MKRLVLPIQANFIYLSRVLERIFADSKVHFPEKKHLIYNEENSDFDIFNCCHPISVFSESGLEQTNIQGAMLYE